MIIACLLTSYIFQLKAYAIFQSVIPRVDNTYVATAVNGERKINYEDDRERGVHVNSVLHAYQYTPFIIVFVLLAAVIIVGGLSDHKLNKKTKTYRLKTLLRIPAIKPI